jgi:phosphatidylserine/phosphatidylglycerophosphate/cardiolipin synthase-like enzyme
MYPTLIFGNQFIKKVLPEIKLCKKNIDILVFFWSFSLHDMSDPVSLLVKELQDALGRGVRVRVLVNNHKVGAMLEQCGFDTRHCYTSKLMHPKVMILDDKKAVIGSHNYTMSGFTLNMEVSAIIDLNGADNELSTFFTHLWGV